MIIIEIDGKDYQLDIDEAKEKGVLKEKWQPIRLLGTDEIQI